MQGADKFRILPVVETWLCPIEAQHFLGRLYITQDVKPQPHLESDRLSWQVLHVSLSLVST